MLCVCDGGKLREECAKVMCGGVGERHGVGMKPYDVIYYARNSRFCFNFLYSNVEYMHIVLFSHLSNPPLKGHSILFTFGNVFGCIKSQVF